MTAHTPGPWTALPEEVDRAYIRIRGTRLGGRYKVANVLTPAYEGVLERGVKETRANAHLIAAAPDMAAMLVRIRDDRSWRTNDHAMWPDLLALIAKATQP